MFKIGGASPSSAVKQVRLFVCCAGTGDSESEYPIPFENNIITFMRYLYRAAQGNPISPEQPIKLPSDSKINQFKIFVPGVSDLGGIAGTGVFDDAKCVANTIKAFLTQNPKISVRLVATGYNRGAVAAVMIAKELSLVNSERLSIRLVLHDPVPGNLINSQGLSFVADNLSAEALDVANCLPLKKVLCLYAHTRGGKELGIINNFYNQLLPVWPSHATVEEDVYLGDHTTYGISMHTGYSIDWNPYDPESTDFALQAPLIQIRTLSFLLENGIAFKAGWGCTQNEIPCFLEGMMKNAYCVLLKKIVSSAVKCHSGEKEQGQIIARAGASYFNRHHKLLMNKFSHSSSLEDCALYVWRISTTEIKDDFAAENSASIPESSTAASKTEKHFDSSNPLFTSDTLKQLKRLGQAAQKNRWSFKK